MLGGMLGALKVALERARGTYPKILLLTRHRALRATRPSNKFADEDTYSISLINKISMVFMTVR